MAERQKKIWVTCEIEKVTCEIKKINEGKKSRTSRNFLRLEAWMNGSGELRRQSKHGGHDDVHGIEHVKSEGPIGYSGEQIHKAKGNKHWKLLRYQHPAGS